MRRRHSWSHRPAYRSLGATRTVGLARRLGWSLRGLAWSGIGAFLFVACSFPDVEFPTDGSASGEEPESTADGTTGGDDGPAEGGGDRTPGDAQGSKDAAGDVTGIGDAARDVSSRDAGDAGKDASPDAKGANCGCAADAMFPTNFSCTGLLTSADACAGQGFSGAPMCGTSGDFVPGCTLSNLIGIGLACTDQAHVTRIQECH
jgi:hypothetical protein